MPPHSEDPTYAPTGVLDESELETLQDSIEQQQQKSTKITTNGRVVALESNTDNANKDAPIRIVWPNVILFTYFHLSALYGLYLLLANRVMWQTIVFAAFLVWFTITSVTAGVHRLWSHRSYKATLPLRIFLAIANSVAYQNSIFEWSRDHRVHHKYSETNADPHNAKRGFFFSHCGWLLSRKHPDVITKGKGIDISDLLNDKVVMFQHKIYYPSMVLMCFIVPTLIPKYFWAETAWNAFHIAAMLRYVYVLNVTWLVNSAAHMFGNKPYDKNINPAENRSVALLAMGEGWHNFHHTFPWDYKTAELGNAVFNSSTTFLNFCAKLGLAYDLKTVNHEIIRKRVLRTGDGSHHEHALWGYGDAEMTTEDHEAVQHVDNKSKVL